MTNPRRRYLPQALLAALLLSPLLANAEVEMLDRIAAVLNDDVIMESQLNRRVTDVLLNIKAQQQPLPPEDVVRPQVLERIIRERLQLALAERVGIRVDDTSLNQALAGIARQNDMNLEQFAEKIRQESYNWPAFREEIRRDMVINQLHQRQVSRRIRITEREVDRFLSSKLGSKLFEEEYRLGHILITVADGASPTQVQQAEAKTTQLLKQLNDGASFRDMAITHSGGQFALEGGDLGWRPAAQLPSLFSSEVVNLATGALAGPLRSGAGFHILLLIDRRGGVDKFVQQHQVRHILIKPSTIRSAEQSLTLARELRERVAAGEDMAALAREFSDDPGSAHGGGSLDWVSPGEMVGAFEQIMQATAPGELSHVFESEYGWHFLHVEATRNEDMSDEFRRLKARQALHQQRYGEELELWVQELRQEAYVDVRL